MHDPTPQEDFGQYSEAHAKQPGYTNGEDKHPMFRQIGALRIFNAGHINVAQVPPRRWLLGVTFCRKFLSGLIGEGGAGKTTIRYAQYLAGVLPAER